MKERELEIWKGLNQVQIEGIEINTDEQLALIKGLKTIIQNCLLGTIKKNAYVIILIILYYSHTDAITYILL